MAAAVLAGNAAVGVGGMEFRTLSGASLCVTRGGSASTAVCLSSGFWGSRVWRNSVNFAGQSVFLRGAKCRKQEGSRGRKLRRVLTRAFAHSVDKLWNEFKDEALLEAQGLRRESEKCCEAIKESYSRARKELQCRFQELKVRADRTGEACQQQYWPQFAAWNRWELWKNPKRWDAQRIGAIILYALVAGAAIRGAYMIVTTPRVSNRELNEISDAYMESVIPEPTPRNIRRLQKRMWQENKPKGFRAKKYTLGPDGEYHHDQNYVGEDAWDPDLDDDLPSVGAMQLIDENDELTPEEKEELKQDLAEIKAKKPRRGSGDMSVQAEVDMVEVIEEAGLPPEEKEQWMEAVLAAKAANLLPTDVPTEIVEQPDEASQKWTWKERLEEWEKVLRKASAEEALESLTSKYEVKLDYNKVRATFKKEMLKGEKSGKKERAFWVARKWWKYRPKMPYTYFLAKVECFEVEAAVYTSDMQKLYVIMKDAFPSEFVVDIPVDPYLRDFLHSHLVDVDVLQRSNFSYLVRGLVAVLPSLLIIWYIRAVQYRARDRANEKIYDLLHMNRDHLIMPDDAADKAKTQYKDVVVGGDIWQVLEEIMIYMSDPMKYYDEGVKLPRGILISGPPGTGKTLLARAIARESGLPFVFASGAEFVESSTGNGSDKIFDIFFTARANAPAFIFIDEIDALAGKNVNDDAERRATFEQLLAELDGESAFPDDCTSLLDAVNDILNKLNFVEVLGTV